MQLPPDTMDFVAVAASVSATFHQPVLLVAAGGALLLVFTVRVALIAVRSTKPGQWWAATAVRDQLLTTTSSQNLDTQADRSRSTASHSGLEGHPGQQRWGRARRVFWHPRRRQNMAVFAGLMVVAVLLLELGWGIDHYSQNIAINVGADLIGAIVTIFVITPIISRADEGRVREHPRLDYGWYVDRVAGSTSAVRILDTYSNLLDGPHTQPESTNLLCVKCGE
jgi:hypothetical protein